MVSRDKIYRDLCSQLVHWTLAADRLGNLDAIASPEGWSELERHTGALLRSSLKRTVRALQRSGTALDHQMRIGSLHDFESKLRGFRRDYLRTETMIDFFADAINTRSTPDMSEILGAADALAVRSMRRILEPLGHTTPPVVTYVDKGLGASILKAGLRLWDRRSVNPVAMIKVVRHNLLRPTALLHEAGHQIAHITDWNRQLRNALQSRLGGRLGRLWGATASEVAADAFAYVNAGYAAVAALRNVVDGGKRMVFRFVPGDPHPVSHIRVLLGVAMCRHSFGRGPWDDLAAVWLERYPLADAPDSVRSLIRASLPRLDDVAEVTLAQPFDAFGGKSLQDQIDPQYVSPRALDELERAAGPRLYSSPYMVNREAIRLLALSGYRFATRPDLAKEMMQKQYESMRVLAQVRAAA